MEISRSPLFDATGTTPALKVKVWDPVVRIFHWLVVTGVALDYFVFADGEKTHQWIGYTVAAALALRLVWGFVASGHANFRDFVKGPATVVRYVKEALAGRPQRHLGHNPAAAIMILALMFTLTAISVSGWMQTTDAYWGVGWVQDVHRWSVNGLLGLVVIHASAAIFESLRHRENLVWSMVTGWKRKDDNHL